VVNKVHPWVCQYLNGKFAYFNVQDQWYLHAGSRNTCSASLASQWQARLLEWPCLMLLVSWLTRYVRDSVSISVASRFGSLDMLSGTYTMVDEICGQL
jgi:hypothetical protein